MVYILYLFREDTKVGEALKRDSYIINEKLQSRLVKQTAWELQTTGSRPPV